ncbi:MAG: response regulator transcription factor [Anaerolineae bacterium]
MTKILLIDDDPLITRPLSRSLESHGYTVSIAENGKDGLQQALDKNTRPDIVVLDVMMPEMNGWDVCKELRAQSGVPILMLTAMSEEIDRILGLELGADDYLTKPFSARELAARIKAMLRRVAIDQTPVPDQTVTIGDLTINYDRREVHRGDKTLNLRYKEFELLTLLMNKKGQVVDRAEIFDQVWGTDWLGDTRTLDVHIRWLREKIEDDPSSPKMIQTVRGVGYRIITG